MTSEEIEKNIEETKAKIKEADAETLIQGYKYYHRNFNPINYTDCQIYQAIKNEIHERLERLDKIERK